MHFTIGGKSHIIIAIFFEGSGGERGWTGEEGRKKEKNSMILP